MLREVELETQATALLTILYTNRATASTPSA
jgi:hypothetical protein